jgi:hypothetical protein
MKMLSENIMLMFMKHVYERGIDRSNGWILNSRENYIASKEAVAIGKILAEKSNWALQEVHWGLPFKAAAIMRSLGLGIVFTIYRCNNLKWTLLTPEGRLVL